MEHERHSTLLQRQDDEQMRRMPAMPPFSPSSSLPPRPSIYSPAPQNRISSSGYPPDKPTKYYDPTTDRPNPLATPQQTREPFGYPTSVGESARSYNNSNYHTSPVTTTFTGPRSPTTHAHPVPPSPRMHAMTSPVSQQNGAPGRPSSDPEPAPEIKPATRPANPMAFSSILSSAEPAAAPAPPAPPVAQAPPAPAAAPTPANFPPPSKTLNRKSSRASMPRSADRSVEPTPTRESSRKSALSKESTPVSARPSNKRQANGQPKPIKASKPAASSLTRGLQASKLNPQAFEDEDEVKALMASLDDEASDLDTDEFKAQKQAHQAENEKRVLEIEERELGKRKRRRLHFGEKEANKLGRHAAAGEIRYRELHADEAFAVVQQQEIDAEKERKKDMQRKRRREKTVTQSLEQKEALLAKAQSVQDEHEKNKLVNAAQRYQRKAEQTKQILARGDKGPDLRTVSPMEPNFSGGTMTTFAADSESSKPKGKGGRGGARLRKSREQKQAEKDSAIAAQAAIDAGEEPPLMSAENRLRIRFSSSGTNSKDADEPAPKPDKPETAKARKAREAREAKEAEAREPKEDDEPMISPEPPVAPEPFVSKGFNQIYDQIWRDLSRKDVRNTFKLAQESQQTKLSNLKKTAILSSKEAKRWQLRTNKGNKDLQARAKRTMREMMTFWKRNEREERDLRRQAEKQELENAKKAEADREANRQQRKLHFLITQTELYSHFVGKKVRTDEVERSTDHPDVAVSTDKITEGDPKAATVDLPEPSGAPAAMVTNFEDLDFDAEDDAQLQAVARANAQHAMQKAQNEARSFNKPAGEPTMDQDGEMNFQNPTMGEINIEQPKMLQAQLKEYQLKGLNWLVNLYEQGINGILADEMGLGKTVQSISVMAYLAEKHNIWGPFLVVAPASTLHNWQQEISKFVPDLKVLPYWGSAADRKVLRKFWDRKHITYTKDAPFHVLITSYQLVVSDVDYLRKMRWQYMILDEAQAIKSSQSSRWKTLLGFHCRNRLLLTGTPIQNNMQELWALLHFIMPSLFDSHDEFSEWFSKDIESHAQSNTKLNEDQLKRLHMILKPFMLRRVKKHVQKELGDKIEEDIFCDLTYRQRALYGQLRNQISIMDLIEKATVGDDQDSGTLMNLVMQFRKVCNHPDLFERAETSSPYSFGYFAEAASFLREGNQVNVGYSTRNLIEYDLPRLIWREDGRLDLPGQNNSKAGFRGKYLEQLMNIWQPQNSTASTAGGDAFSWARFAGVSPSELAAAASKDVYARAVDLAKKPSNLGRFNVIYDEAEDGKYTPPQSLFSIVERNDRRPLAEITTEGYLNKLMNVSQISFAESGMSRMDQCARPNASAPPIQVSCASRGATIEKENTLFNIPMRRALYGLNELEEKALVESKVPSSLVPKQRMLPAPTSEKKRFSNIVVPSMRRFVTDSGKLAKLDQLLFKLKEGGHRVLLYFQMTRMIDLIEEYLTYRNYKYLRLDGSTKLEDRRDTVHDFQTRPEIFIFLLSTRAGGLGINLTSADTVIFYDSDWNPTIDSQAMDRAHRLGQTRQVTVYRMITRGTIEERIRKRALQKEEVQRVVISGGSGAGVDFNTRSRENRTKDIAMWLVDDDEAAEIERKEKELEEKLEKDGGATGKKQKGGKKRKAAEANLEDLYHEGEGHFDDGSAGNKASGAATPTAAEAFTTGKGKGKGKRGGVSKKAKTAKQRLAMADGNVDAEL